MLYSSNNYSIWHPVVINNYYLVIQVRKNENNIPNNYSYHNYKDTVQQLLHKFRAYIGPNAPCQDI